MELFNTINIYAWSALLNLFVSLFFGLLIFLHNRRKPLFQTFLLLNLAIAFWSLGYFFWQISETPDRALLWTRLLSIGSTLIPATFLHWTFSFLNLNKQRKKHIITLYLFSGVFLLFSFSEIF